MIRKTLFRTKRATANPLLTGYGRLYNFFAVQKGITNTGFKVPTEADFQTLVTYIGSNPGQKLKSSGTDHWTTNNGTDTVNFSARGGGYRSTNGSFFGLKDSARFWTSEYKVLILTDSSTGATFSTNDAGVGASVRLLKITPSASDLLKSDGEACDPYIGNDGQIYPTVKIGTQVWTSRNLRETKFSTGATIKHIPLAEDWEEAWYVPNLAEVYQGGWLFGVSLDGRSGYALSVDDIQFEGYNNGGLTYYPGWDQAVFETPNISYEGYSDWFLPTKALWEIINAELADMPELQSWYYWTADEIDEFQAWFADPSAKEVNNILKNIGTIRVKAAREVQIPEHEAQCIYDNSIENILDLPYIVTYNGEAVTHNGEYVINTP